MNSKKPQIYTNRFNIPIIPAIWLASTEGYDLIPQPKTISATTTLKSTKSIVLTQQLAQAKRIGLVDIADLVPSRMGTAIHSGIENTWLHDQHRTEAMYNLGVPQGVIDSIKINPTNPNPDDYNIYFERRTTKEIGGYNISGKFDVVEDGQLRDTKSTKVRNFTGKLNDEKYIIQGSIYRWLNSDIITNDRMVIDFVLTDWNATNAATQKDYPSSAIQSRELPLKSLQWTENFLKEKIYEIDKYIDKQEVDMPRCTPDEVWQRPTTWAFFTKKTNKRPQRVVFSHEEALQLHSDYGFKGKIEERPGKVYYCAYCPARLYCQQAEEYTRLKLLD